MELIKYIGEEFEKKFKSDSITNEQLNRIWENRSRIAKNVLNESPLQYCERMFKVEENDTPTLKDAIEHLKNYQTIISVTISMLSDKPE